MFETLFFMAVVVVIVAYLVHNQTPTYKPKYPIHQEHHDWLDDSDG